MFTSFYYWYTPVCTSVSDFACVYENVILFYICFQLLDSDAFLTNKLTLKDLVQLDLTVVAPMLRSDGLYSNFWCGMSEDFYYVRTDEYKPILYRERKGCFAIPMVHSAVLINLRHKDSQVLTFLSDNIPDYKGPQDDIITFALAAKHYGM